MRRATNAQEWLTRAGSLEMFARGLWSRCRWTGWSRSVPMWSAGFSAETGDRPRAGRSQLEAYGVSPGDADEARAIAPGPNAAGPGASGPDAPSLRALRVAEQTAEGSVEDGADCGRVGWLRGFGGGRVGRAEGLAEDVVELRGSSRRSMATHYVGPQAHGGGPLER